MYEREVIISIATCIFFNILLNSFDIYSDITLCYETLNFNVGDSLLLTGCRICDGKTNDDVYSVDESNCKRCVIANNYFQCGNSFHILDKLDKHLKSGKCGPEKFGVDWAPFYKNYAPSTDDCDNGPNYILKQHQSQSAKACCVQTFQNDSASNETLKMQFHNPLDNINKTIIAVQHQYLTDNRYKLNYDIYILSTKLNAFHCTKLFYRHFKGLFMHMKAFLDDNVASSTNKSENEWYFKFSRSQEDKVFIENGYKPEDGCGFLVTSLQENFVRNNLLGICCWE